MGPISQGRIPVWIAASRLPRRAHLRRRAPAAQALARAAGLRQQRRFGEAVEAMRLAASLEPNSATIFHDLGLVCLEAGMPAEAAGSFRRAAQLKLTFAQAFWRLGVALELCGEIDSAADALRKATELQPRLRDAQFRLGTPHKEGGIAGGAICAKLKSSLCACQRGLLRRLAERDAVDLDRSLGVQLHQPA